LVGGQTLSAQHLEGRLAPPQQQVVSEASGSPQQRLVRSGLLPQLGLVLLGSLPPLVRLEQPLHLPLEALVHLRRLRPALHLGRVPLVAGGRLVRPSQLLALLLRRLALQHLRQHSGQQQPRHLVVGRSALRRRLSHLEPPRRHLARSEPPRPPRTHSVHLRQALLGPLRLLQVRLGRLPPVPSALLSPVLSGQHLVLPLAPQQQARSVLPPVASARGLASVRGLAPLALPPNRLESARQVWVLLGRRRLARGHSEPQQLAPLGSLGPGRSVPRHSSKQHWRSRLCRRCRCRRPTRCGWQTYRRIHTET